jgi:hypothetical protein
VPLPKPTALPSVPDSEAVGLGKVRLNRNLRRVILKRRSIKDLAGAPFFQAVDAGLKTCPKALHATGRSVRSGNPDKPGNVLDGASVAEDASR